MFDRLIKPDISAPGNRIRGLLAPGSKLAKTASRAGGWDGNGARLELSGRAWRRRRCPGGGAGAQLAAEACAAGVRVLLQMGAQDLKLGLLAAGAGSLNVAASVGRGKAPTVIAGETDRVGQSLRSADLRVGCE
jgi:hypothetical protein